MADDDEPADKLLQRQSIRRLPEKDPIHVRLINFLFEWIVFLYELVSLFLKSLVSPREYEERSRSNNRPGPPHSSHYNGGVGFPGKSKSFIVQDVVLQAEVRRKSIDLRARPPQSKCILIDEVVIETLFGRVID